jgi:hypothetical protein
LTRTFMRLHQTPLGFDPDHLWVAGITLPTSPFDSSEKRNAYYREVAARLRALPGVRAVAASTMPPLTSGPPATVSTESMDAPDAARISVQEVSAEFFDTVGILVVAGRAFDDHDSAEGRPVVIVNERAARELFGGSAAALGRRVRLNGEPWREVVGVVGSVRSTFFNRLEWQSDAIIYRPAAQGLRSPTSPVSATFGFELHIRASRPITAAEVHSAILSANPNAIFTGLRAAAELIGAATRQPAFRMTLLGWFASISLFLAAMGVYGLMSQAVGQRRQEIAVRLALGARPMQIMSGVTLRALLVGLMGLGAGAAAAFVLGNALEGLLYGVRAQDALSFATAGGALLAITMLAALGPAIRATRVDLVSVLRGD